MPFLFLLFAFMLITLGLGLFLGWLIWRYDNGVEGELSSLNTEITFWRKNLDQCRMELSNEQDAIALLREERANLKSRIQALERAPDE